MFKSIGRIMQWIGPRRKRLYRGFVYSFFHTLFTAMPIMLAAYGLNLIIEDKNGVRGLTLDWVFYMAGLMALAVAGRFWFAYLRASTQESIGCEAAADERTRIGGILKQVPLGFFSRKNTGEIAAAATTDLSFIELLGMKMIDVVVNGYISALTMVACLAVYSPPVAGVALTGILLSALFLRLLGRQSRKNAPVHQKAQDNMIAAAIEYIRGMPAVKAFKQDGVSREGIRRAFQMSKDINIRIERNYVPYNCLHLFALKGASAGIVAVSAILAANGAMELPTMLMMAIFSFVIFGHVETVNNAAHVLEVIDATLDKLEEIHHAESIDQDSQDMRLTQYDICFREVGFAYDQREVLRDVSFIMPENTTTAIVGPSGSGKTTICNLIAKFYLANRGSVSIGGVDIRDITSGSLMENISMVFQKVYLFQDTIANNIRFAKPEAGMDEVVKAAKQACCHDFIMALPQGYDTVIGDGGATLSGGEKQRISIARAMLKNAPIVILDEATASVDPENEQAIQQAISALVRGKTIIIIAHRLATIESADQILVMEDGQIVQRGNHEELSKQEGIYQRFLTIRQTAEGWSI
ncbi:ABC transporter ATP-binding protein [Paenibacillus sp. GM2]|uniref:ABC transporter ATP-binding protein n=1 Tax=Paenibacillus sp. GM2 TaxID=1622070 RepID=UPI0008388BB1|nr:ABC transporter ATP-binding protein [Paenibacillus sp. GM2]